jgi:hypothetical protein
VRPAAYRWGDAAGVFVPHGEATRSDAEILRELFIAIHEWCQEVGWEAPPAKLKFRCWGGGKFEFPIPPLAALRHAAARAAAAKGKKP